MISRAPISGDTDVSGGVRLESAADAVLRTGRIEGVFRGDVFSQWRNKMDSFSQRQRSLHISPSQPARRRIMP